MKHRTTGRAIGWGTGSLLVTMAMAMPAVAAVQNAPAFDAAAATAQYLARLSGHARAQSDAYFEGGYWIILWGALVAILSNWLVLRTGLSARFRVWAARLSKRAGVQTLLWVVPYSIVTTLIAAPWTIYADFIRERRYGLMNQSFGAWLGDQGIGFVVGTISLMLVLPLLLLVVRKSPQRWWLWGAGTMTIVAGFFALIAPVFISPLFNSYTELAPGPVRERIVAMASSQHVPADHIYVFDASRQTKRISANVSGLGPTIRISLNDNLLNRTSLAETAAVMGHELGHYVLNHVWKMIGGMLLILLFAFAITARAVPALLRKYGATWGVTRMDDVAAVPAYFIVLSVLFLLLTPVTNSLVRHNESEADAFGLDVAREPDGFAEAALALSEYRKMEPGPIEEMLFYDHPSGRTRIAMSMAWKAAHIDEIRARERAAAVAPQGGAAVAPARVATAPHP